MKQLEFEGRTILITGATRGIGKQIADDLSGFGASLILTGTNQEEIDSLNADAVLHNRNARYYCLDILNPESLDNFIEQIGEFERIDGLVNNAGINRLNSINEVLDHDWNEMVAVNLTAPFRILKAVSTKMISRQYGRVINISSIFGKISKAKRVVYSATKFGLHGLTVGASNDLARFNIMVNTISPGFVLTDLTRKNLSETEMKELAEQIPSKRLASVTDISTFAVFLLSELNQYLTGQNVIIDGGFTNV
jgi:NAD(P)-dependent dehydrogenase (short-subunit alcohol dehydrogenase family)